MASARKDRSDPLEIRRIGHRHAILVPARTAEVVDVRRIGAEIAKLDETLAGLDKRRATVEARRARLLEVQRQFESLPVERESDDPVVPLEPPRLSRDVASERAKLRAASLAAPSELAKDRS